jgi:hypothetical protein
MTREKNKIKQHMFTIELKGYKHHQNNGKGVSPTIVPRDQWNEQDAGNTNKF